jgi:hypothetical protein
MNSQKPIPYDLAEYTDLRTRDVIGEKCYQMISRYINPLHCICPVDG